MNPEQIDIIGYVASFFVAISFLFKNLKTIRYINLLGCLIFVGYGYLLESKPIILTNTFIVLVQIYFLFIHKPNVPPKEIES